jgi:hypothetical protein
MAYAVDERVDAYIDALPDWQQAICRQVRDLVHAADPEVSETVKRTRQPYFVLQGNICALLAANNHVNVFSTTALSFLIPTGSSPLATTTRPPAPLPSARARPSMRLPSAPCSSTSSPATAPAAGAN